MQFHECSYFNWASTRSQHKYSNVFLKFLTQTYWFLFFFFAICTNAKSSWSGWKKNPSRMIFSFPLSSVQSRKTPEEWCICGRIADQGWPLLASPLWLEFKRSSEKHLQKTTSKQILRLPVAVASFTGIEDYPCQVQIAKWQALKEHWVRFTSWCETN